MEHRPTDWLSRHLCWALWLSLGFVAGACDDGGSAPGTDTDDTETGADSAESSGEGATSGGAGASGETGAHETSASETETETQGESGPGSTGPNDPEVPEVPEDCVTDIPCAGDTQCVALPGYACNDALDPPRCQQIRCGPVGTPCDDHSFCDDAGVCIEGVCTARIEAEAACVKDCIALPQRHNIEFGDDVCDATLIVDACFTLCAGVPDTGWWDDECGGRDVDFMNSVIRCTESAICTIEVRCGGSGATGYEDAEAC